MKISASDLVRGAMAGMVGTVTMTVVLGAGRAIHVDRSTAPAEITNNVQEKAGVRDELSEGAFSVSWMAAHFGYGAAWGAVFALLRPFLPLPSTAAGALFGIGLWGLSYLGVMPAMGLYPPPHKDSPSRLATMVAAHVVYGVTLARANRTAGAGRRDVSISVPAGRRGLVQAGSSRP